MLEARISTKSGFVELEMGPAAKGSSGTDNFPEYTPRLDSVPSARRTRSAPFKRGLRSKRFNRDV
jgi:hypothetical protein